MGDSIITKLENLIKAHGFEHFGFASFEKPLSLSFYQNWLQEGLHADMEYLKRHLPLKSDPQTWLPQARSALVFGLNYIPHPQPSAFPLKHLKVARYAQGEDYHAFFKSRLEELCKILADSFPGESFVAHTDSSPIMERDLAYRAQLGWFGKNSCLIHPKRGSFFLIGEILTSLDFISPAQPLPDFCGHCRRCIEACPTGAIREDRTLDARKCISYLNIELKGLPSPQQTQWIGEWFFGCDICQEVCPWNQKIFTQQLKTEPATRDNQIEELRFLLTSSSRELEKSFRHFPLLRRRAFGLKRNALILAYNLKAVELETEIQHTSQTSEKLRPLADWVLKNLQTSKKLPT